VAGRVKGFAPWKPQKRTEPLLQDIEHVLEEYREYLPLTVRQVFYRLAGKGYPKTENFYENVQEKCNRARRCELVPFSSIRDDGVSRQAGETLTYDSPDEYYRTHEELSNFYKRSWHADQPAYVAVLCEAAGMVPMLARVAREYRASVASSSGFDSLTVKYELFTEAVDRMEEYDQNTILLHLGDHDPSGVSLHESMAEDFQAFARDRGYAPELLELRRVALTPAQITRYGIEPDPGGVKPSDSRSKSFIERGLEPAAQLEAIPPDTLVALMRQELESTLDMETFRVSQERERQERQEVQRKLDVVNEALREAFGLH
jgi:hypothetical protein